MLALCWSLQVGFFICYKLVVFLDVPIFQAILKLNELTEAGFDVETKYVFSEDLPIGAVVSQLPRTGDIDKGSVITLTVSKGSEFVFIPNLFSLTQAMAVDTLKDLDLKVIIKKVGDKKIKVVTNISPKVGERVKRGSTVTITVG